MKKWNKDVAHVLTAANTHLTVCYKVFKHHCPDSFWEWQLQTPWRLMGCKKLSCFALNLFKLNTRMRYRINNLSHVTSFYTRLWLDILTLWSERMVRVYCIVFHDGWTLTTEQSLKHLKVYFVLSFFVVHVTPLSTVSAGVRSFCEFVCPVFLYAFCMRAVKWPTSTCFIKSAFSHSPSLLVSSLSFFTFSSPVVLICTHLKAVYLSQARSCVLQLFAVIRSYCR